MMYTIFSAIFIAIEVILLGIFIGVSIKNKKAFTKKTMWYAAPVFVVVYSLYLMGYIYAGNKVTFFALLKLISASLEAFVLKANADILGALTQADACYFAAVILAILLAGATLVAGIIGLCGARLRNAIRVHRAIKNRNGFVLGDSKDALEYARKNDAVVMNFGDSDNKKSLIERKYNVVDASFVGANRSLKSKIKRSGCKKIDFVVFVDSHFAYTQLIDWFMGHFADMDDTIFELHIEASLEEMDIINRKFIDVKTSDNICIKSFNKYELLSRKFIMQHPFSLYIPQDFYGDFRTIKPDKQINVVSIGFGKVNYELMKLLIMQNQFVEYRGDGAKYPFANHPVNYYIYDSEENKIYSEMVQKIHHSATQNKKTNLNATEPICNMEEIKTVNVYSTEFAEKLDGIITPDDCYTFVFVSLGSDFENMAYAESLSGLYGMDKSRIFVRIRQNETFVTADDNIVSYGYEGNILTRDVIVDDALDDLAMAINASYTSKSGKSIASVKDYNKRPTIERSSNIYHAASIFFKLGLLGVQCVYKGELSQDDITRQQEFKRQLKEVYQLEVGKDYEYASYFAATTRAMMGFCEHSRWVAHYLLMGFLPMEKLIVHETKQGKKVVSKDIANRKHYCLRNYYALDGYHKELARLKGVDVKDVETYKYDYMFADDQYFDELQEVGYILQWMDGAEPKDGSCI